MKEFNEIDELFGNAFGDFEVTPPDDVKVAIDKQISFGKKPKGYWYFGLRLLTLIAFLAINFAAKVELKDSNSSENLKANVLVDSDTNSNSAKGEERSNEERLGSDIQENDSIIVGEGENRNEISVKSKGKNDKIKTTVNSKPNFQHISRNKEIVPKAKKKKNRIAGNKIKNWNKDEEDLFNPQYNSDVRNNDDGNQTISETTISVNSNDEKTDIKPEEINNSDVAVNLTDSANSTELVDSLKNGSDEPDNGLPTQQNKINMGNWIQLSAGPGFGMNGSKVNSSGLEIATRNPIIDASLEYNFGFNERLGLSTGIGFNQFDEVLVQSISILDSTFLGMVADSVWNPNTMEYDSISVASYEFFNSVETTGNSFRFTSIEIPVFATWMINKESRYDLSVSAGVKFSYNSFKAMDGDQLKDMVSLNTFGVKFMVRPQFIYHLGKFGLGAYMRYSSEILPVVEYSGTKRLLQEFGAGVLFRYSF